MGEIQIDDIVHNNGNKKQVVGIEYNKENTFNTLVVIDLTSGKVEFYLENEVEAMDAVGQG